MGVYGNDLGDFSEQAHAVYALHHQPHGLHAVGRQLQVHHTLYNAAPQDAVCEIVVAESASFAEFMHIPWKLSKEQSRPINMTKLQVPDHLLWGGTGELHGNALYFDVQQ